MARKGLPAVEVWKMGDNSCNLMTPDTTRVVSLPGGEKGQAVISHVVDNTAAIAATIDDIRLVDLETFQASQVLYTG